VSSRTIDHRGDATRACQYREAHPHRDRAGITPQSTTISQLRSAPTPPPP
jgi:hypothetical protein